ncbi:MAG: nucleotide exchange factor GrpE [Arachnia sp.]
MSEFDSTGEGPVPSPEAQPAEGEAAEDQATEAVAEAAAPEWEAVAAERTADLQRVQAEYVNYKKRVDRDRNLARQAGVEAVVRDLMPVLDSIELAKSHEDLSGGFKMVAEELAKLAAKHGLVAFGSVGDEFDPTHHEALMQVPMEGVSVTTVSQVMQPGYQLGDRVIRPARVAVANP